ncbi:unnamed protein product [Parnassius mnemosyne]|uniref:RNA-directed DNA polymerase n=1 Tax=Parnassius mnemosyne TaxID=213953 RepID=A0AAV1LK81_9NEOP
MRAPYPPGYKLRHKPHPASIRARGGMPRDKRLKSRRSKKRRDERRDFSPTQSHHSRSRSRHRARSSSSHRARSGSLYRARSKSLLRVRSKSPRRARSRSASRVVSRTPRVSRTRRDSSKQSFNFNITGDHSHSRNAEREHLIELDDGQPNRNHMNASLFEKMLDIMKDYKKNSDNSDRFPALNVIPDFDPMTREQTVDTWIQKVEECAQIYNWNDKQTIHYALPKLCGVAKTWYQGLPSVFFSWREWKEKLLNSFPSRENYAKLLTEMLSKKSKFGESLELYYYSKLNLLNRCSIFGKNAVDCIIYGIEDRGIRLSIQAAQFNEPEQLLKYFKTIRVGQNKELDVNKNKEKRYVASNISSSSDTGKTSKPDHKVTCYNCNETGHTFYRCPKPTIKCKNCRWRGHTAENCPKNISQTSKHIDKPGTSVKTVMEVNIPENSNAKYRVPVKVNSNVLLAHIDLGSDCTLIRLSDAEKLCVKWQAVDSPVLKGLGNTPYRPLGVTYVTIDIQGVVEENVKALIVDDYMISHPILIGHTYTERPTIEIIKTPSDLIIKRSNFQIENVKIPLVVSEKVVLKRDGLSIICAKSEKDISGSIYVHGDIRGPPGKEYFLLPGQFEIINGITKLLAQCLSDNTVEIGHGTLITRARSITNNCNDMASVLNINLEDESITLNCGLVDPEQKNKLADLLDKYKGCFSSNLHNLGFTTAAEMVIHLKDSSPIVYRPYRLSFADRQLVRNMIQEMLDCGIVRESASPYASPIVLIQKKSGEKRLCVDYRALNNKTIKEHYPLPRIEDQLDLLSGSKLFITLDLASGYYQIPIEEGSRDKTAFVTPDGQFEYTRMPFGLVNAPSVFQRAMNKILNKARVKYALVYMDDILIPAKTFDEGLLRLEEVLALLKEGGLTLKLSKCRFFFDKIEYLGFEISADGVRPGSLKTDAVSKFPTPLNQHDVRRFIGLASFFRRFIKDFAILARPLTTLLKKDVKWQWSYEEQKSFETLKTKLVQRPVLALYNPEAETQLHTDASKLGIAGILLQRNSNCILQPIAYYSRQTNPDEQKLHSFELETLAVVASLNKFRVYLLGIKFKIFTDCNALRTTLTKRDLIPRIARWWIQFQEFDCTIEHKPGEKWRMSMH